LVAASRTPLLALLLPLLLLVLMVVVASRLPRSSSADSDRTCLSPLFTQMRQMTQIGRPVTNSCLEGYNGTIFCYGQTGSGKTFTTFGPPDEDGGGGGGGSSSIPESSPSPSRRDSGGGGGGGKAALSATSAKGKGDWGGTGTTTGEQRGLVPRVLEYLFEQFTASGLSSQQQQVMR